MSREEAYEQAAICYRRATYDDDAARCYRLAGAHRRAAEIYEAAEQYTEAAASFADAGLPEFGAWLLADLASQPDQARALLATTGRRGGATTGRRGGAAAGHEAQGPGLRDRLVLARCDIADGAAADVIRPVIADVCAALADVSERSDQVCEEWAVALSEVAQRYDQVALVFAAAVRGGRYGAEQRWKAWSRDVLHAEIVVPFLAPRAVPAATAPAATAPATVPVVPVPAAAPPPDAWL